jgi:hypothetical protein
MYVLIGIFAIAVIWWLVKEQKRKAKNKAEPIVNELPFPCTITGSVDMSPMEDRVKALAIEAVSKGITITGDYVADYQAQGGEMTLTGNGFRFVFDVNGQIIQSLSHLNLFAVDYPVEGGMFPDGSLGVSVVVGSTKVGVKGQVTNGVFTKGEVRKGQLPHIYGVLNGTVSKT